MDALTILYHDVLDGDYDASGFSGTAAARYKFRTAEFARHLDEIGKVAGPARPVEDLLAEPSGKDFLFTIDDGGVSALHIADELEKRGWLGHFFITTDHIGEPSFVSEEQIRELDERGHVIGSHSCSHPNRMSELAQDQIEAEWCDSLQKLADILGKEILTASVPAGFYRRNVAVAAAKCGIRYLFTSEPTKTLGEIDGCTILGRFTVYDEMSAQMAADLAGPSQKARLRQAAMWNSKKLVKSLAGPLWDKVRERLLSKG